MAEIKLYLDEDISHTVAKVLRSRGYDVISAHEVGLRSKTDDEQLDYAIENERILITFNNFILNFFEFFQYFQGVVLHYIIAFSKPLFIC